MDETGTISWVTKLIALIALIVIFTFFAVSSESFRSFDTAVNILDASYYIGFLAIGGNIRYYHRRY